MPNLDLDWEVTQMEAKATEQLAEKREFASGSIEEQLQHLEKLTAERDTLVKEKEAATLRRKKSQIYSGTRYHQIK